MNRNTSVEYWHLREVCPVFLDYILGREFQHRTQGPLEAGEGGREKSEKRAILSERGEAEWVNCELIFPEWANEPEGRFLGAHFFGSFLCASKEMNI